MCPISCPNVPASWSSRRLVDESSIDVDEAARQCEGVYFTRVDDVKMPGEVGSTRLGGDRPPELLDVAGDARIVEQWKLRVDFGGISLTDRDLLFIRHCTSEARETEGDSDRNAQRHVVSCSSQGERLQIWRRPWRVIPSLASLVQDDTVGSRARA